MIESREAARKMGSWKARKISKKTKGNQTTGRQKGIFCSALERTICRRNRSWKMAEYNLVMSRLTGEKRRGKK